ncbi:MAG TPA: Fur family transcriptional regulator [Byssovorax sp.]|jgi:Fur family ferric uptake transcriptional regulator
MSPGGARVAAGGRSSPGRARKTVIEPPPPSREHQAMDAEALDRLRARLAAYMVKKGLRSTSQRRIIVDTFFEGQSHRTIEDLLGEVRSRDRGIGYATVYRTLKLLAESGVASERRFGDGLSRYELADDASAHHDHLICVTCGKIVEFEEPRIEELQDEIAARYGFVIKSHKHEMYGTCPDCIG